MHHNNPYRTAEIDPGIKTQQVDNGNGLQVHVLTAGEQANPCVLLLHGFPELAFSWRKIIMPLAEAGYYVIAPDQRGYGNTTGSDNSYDGDLASFRLLNLVQDAVGLVKALGKDSVKAVVGHDFGSSVAAWCAVTRPDIFQSVVMMSAPFAGTPSVSVNKSQSSVATIDHDALEQLNPPRKHYQWYYSTPHANDNMMNCEQGLMNFLRAYYHHKSADWPDNHPHRLESWAAEQLAIMPTYYVMHKDAGMAETVAEEMPDSATIEAATWLTNGELSVYTNAFEKTGFQGGLNWYRCVTSGRYTTEMQQFSGHKIDIPSMFIAGASDWGIFQKPGEYESMQQSACSQFQGSHLIKGAGHWVQQEQPAMVLDALVEFIKR